MDWKEVSTQAEFDLHAKAGFGLIVRTGDFIAWGSSHVEAWGSSHVVARGQVMLRLFSALKITASAQVIIAKHGNAGEVTGGRVIEMAPPATTAEWCDFYGVPHEDGVATVYKGVDINFRSPRGGDYTPGSAPVAPDWDGGDRECGGGLHFSPHPRMTREFANDAARFVACQVALVDMRAPLAGDEYPQKIKARAAGGLLAAPACVALMKDVYERRPAPADCCSPRLRLATGPCACALPGRCRPTPALM